MRFTDEQWEGFTSRAANMIIAMCAASASVGFLLGVLVAR